MCVWHNLKSACLANNTIQPPCTRTITTPAIPAFKIRAARVADLCLHAKYASSLPSTAFFSRSYWFSLVPYWRPLSRLYWFSLAAYWFSLAAYCRWGIA